MPEEDKKRGLYPKYIGITRADGKDLPGQKHEKCDLFVLDITHDPFALPAIMIYATACQLEYPALYKELMEKLEAHPDWKKMQKTSATWSAESGPTSPMHKKLLANDLRQTKVTMAVCCHCATQLIPRYVIPMGHEVESLIWICPGSCDGKRAEPMWVIVDAGRL